VDAGYFSLRNYVYLSCENGVYFCPDAWPRTVDYGGRLSVQAVKLYLDGALGSWGAALLAPYSGTHPHTHTYAHTHTHTHTHTQAHTGTHKHRALAHTSPTDSCSLDL
jgi:predicted amidohydrolase YtcJ